MRSVGRRVAAVVRPPAFVALALAALPGASAAQCLLSVAPADGDTGYGPRDYACEGMYVGLQSAPLAIEVISLARGWPDEPLRALLDAGVQRLEVRVPPAATLSGQGLGDSVRVLGRTREANLNWAMDGWARGDEPLSWDLRPVIAPLGLELSRLGVAGRTVDQAGDPVFVPVELARPGSAAAGDGPLRLVFHLPTAGQAEVCLRRDGSAVCEQAEEHLGGGYFDGFFEVALPEWPAGEVRELTVRWRQVGGGDYAYDRLLVYRW